MKELLLNHSWKMHEAPLSWDAAHYASVKRMEDDWYSCELPVDVHMPLIEAGVIKEPTLSDYFLEEEWTERRSWWFFKNFDFSAEDLEDADIVELSMEGLDAEAVIFVNGEQVGCHHSVHYPFILNVKEFLKAGENELAVRMTSGLEKISDEQLSEIDWAVCLESSNGGEFRGDARRAFVRRPQYTIGWTFL